MAATDDVEQHPKRIANKDQKFIWVGDKNMKAVQKFAWENWWWPEEKKKGIMWQSPDQRHQVMLHKTDSDHRAYDNAVADFRRAGLKI